MTDSKTVVEDLAAWLTAVWDERQRIYEYPPDFVEDSGSARGPGWGKIGGDTCEVCDSYQFSGYESVVEDAWYEHMEQYHQRAEVLARIAADRSILGHVLTWTHRVVDEDCWFTCPAATEERDGGETCNDDERGKPCQCGLEWRQLQILGPLASAHADKPSFRPEWLVE